MQVIANANETILSVLNKFNKKTLSNRLFHYCVQKSVEEGVLLFNSLTMEELLLTQEEFSKIYQNDYLKEHWFVVPENTNDKEYVDLVKWILSNSVKKEKGITSYKIFTTTDCNARCFYCFELGRSRFPMTNETALKVVEYIKAHCEGKPVKLAWFGGEPLFNAGVIDTICDGLRREGVAFKSTMISNGYLFDEETAQKAAKQWNLKRVQITLDGTEKVYNKIKAYIYKGENAYQTVLNNIGYLLDASVSITIRMNMDLYNAEDLLSLVDELAERFGGRKGISAYAHHLFKEGIPMAELYASEEWILRDAAMCQLEERIRQSGLQPRRGLPTTIKVNHCMADNSNSVSILPDGKIGLCEHFSESEFIGHIDHEGFDSAVIESWKERTPEVPECATCFYYPMCIRLKKCPNEGPCYPLYRNEILRRVQSEMTGQYEMWLAKTELEDEESMEDC